MSTISITWTVETDGDPDTLGRTLTEYVTHPDSPLLTDYADNEAREVDGYEGPFVLSSEATYRVDL